MFRSLSRFICLLSAGALLLCGQPAFSVHAKIQRQAARQLSSVKQVFQKSLALPGKSLSSQQTVLYMTEGSVQVIPLAYQCPVMTCYSSNPAAVSVTPEGVVTAAAPGSATILYGSFGSVYSLRVQVVPLSGESPAASSGQIPAKNTEENIFNIEENMIFIEKGETYQTPLGPSSTVSRAALGWSSSDSSVARVDNLGKITAKGRGTAVITCTDGVNSASFNVNVVTRDYDGDSCTFSMLTESGKTRTYTLFKQNTYQYPKYNKYIGWHGCATCSLATVLGAYQPDYAGILPSEVIDGPEKETVSASAWRREHAERSLPKQMPLSLYGISSILNHCGVDTQYVRTYKEQAAKEDISSHLKTGNPVIFEVRQKSNRTGKKSSRWTNSYHTMVLLGILTNGKVLVCDSIDKNWKNNGNRIVITELDDVMEFMFPCTEFSKSMYYDGASSDGGYIKVFES